MEEQKTKRVWVSRFLVIGFLVFAGFGFVDFDNTEEQVIAYRRCVTRGMEKWDVDQFEAEMRCKHGYPGGVEHEVWEEMFNHDPLTPLGEVVRMDDNDVPLTPLGEVVDDNDVPPRGSMPPSHVRGS